MRGCLMLAVAMMGCGDDAVELTGGDPLPGDTPAVATVTEPPEPPAHGVQVVVAGDVLAPGEEVEMCQWIKAGNAEAAHITRIEMAAPLGLHHSVISKAPTEHDDDVEACFGFPEEVMSGVSIPVPIFASSTQVNREDLVMPDGVGISVDADQQLIVNYHFVNSTGEDLVPEVTVNLHFAEEQVEQEASFFAFGNIGDIRIPAQGTQSITMTCPFPLGGQLITATPHMHQKGTGMSIFRHDGTQTTDEMLVDGEGWFAPETTRFDPLVTLTQGEGLTFTCSWDNPTDSVVRFGETSADEMCFVFGFYTPASNDLFGFEQFGCTVEDITTSP